MAFKNLNAFGAGELTPELYERGNLDKFRTGLKSLRNAIVTKMGGLKSRAGTLNIALPNDNARGKYLYIQAENTLFEFTNGNLRLFIDFDPQYNTFSTQTDVDLSAYSVMSDITNIHFTYGNRYIFVFSQGFEVIQIDINKIFTDPINAVSQMRNNVAPRNPWSLATTFSYVAGGTAPTGYDIDYAVTFVADGIETFIANTNQTRKKPANTNEHNVITVTIDKTLIPDDFPPDEVRIYQRPRDGGGFLYVGNSTFPVETGTTATFTFKDFGVEPDPTNLPPEYVSQFIADTKSPIIDLPGQYQYIIKAKTGLVYQDRLVFSGTTLANRVFGSRTGATAMTRDFPLQSDSAVSFKVGSDGALKVNRFFDGRGLMIFTSVGIYETPSELLTPDSAFGIKRGPYVADEGIAPQQLGEYVTIYDRRLKAVIGLIPTGNDGAYSYDEFSIFSAHLLKGKRIVSWDIQEAETTVLWIVLDDGKVLSFSFQNEQQVRSWARHDFQDGIVEEVIVMDVEGGTDVVCFIVNRDGTRSIERLTDRDASFISYIGTDASKFYNENLLVSIASPTATVAPVTPDVWDGPLTITPAFSGFTVADGEILRVYTDTYQFIDLEVTDDTLGVLTVTPSSEYPESMATLTIEDGLWMTYKTLTGLDHLEGKQVSVRVDGFTHASPLNTDPSKNFSKYTVVGGEITLEGETRGAYVSVGLPFVVDIETLEIDTVEQAPTKLEGQIVNKLWLSYFESLFLYAAASYPDDDTVTGMENQEFQVEEDPDVGILYSQPMLPQSERLEMQIQGDWKVRGSVALRNVDPQPIGLRAIIPDTEVVRN